MTSSQRILLAGATGAIGRRLTPALLAAGHDVHALVRSAEAELVARSLGARPVRGDALDRDAVMAAVGSVRPDVVVHQLTALPRAEVGPRGMTPYLEATNRVRREATRNLADAAERHGAQRLIAQSIAFAYRPEGPEVVDEDHPLDLGAPGAWGEVVRAVADLEDAVLSAPNLVGVVLRYGGFYGPGTAVAHDGFLGELVRRRRLPVVGGGAGMQSFLHIDDAVSATIAALEAPSGVWNVADDHPVAAREWIPALAHALGAPPPRHVPAWAVRMLAGPDAVRTMTVQRGASNARFAWDLGWRPSHPDWRDGFATLAAPSERAVAA